MRRKVNIGEIARRAGVCIGTVSRVLNGRDRVLPATRERILDIIKDTGYRPSSLGRGLVLGRTHTVLLAIPDIADPYYAWVSKTIGHKCRDRGYRLLLGDSNYDPKIEAAHLERVRDGSADGLVISPLPGTHNRSLLRELAQSGLSIVVLDNPIDGVSTCCVRRDDREVGRLGAEYLHDKGHRSVAFVRSHGEFQMVRDRLAGFEDACDKREIPASQRHVITLPDAVERAEATLSEFFQQHPEVTALFAESENIALLCINLLLLAGRKIPGEVAVMGVGDTLRKFMTPIPMTTVCLEGDGVCEPAVVNLLNQIEHPLSRRGKPVQIVLHPFVHSRESA